MQNQLTGMWSEIGYHVRPLKRTIFCKTLPLEKYTSGGIEIPSHLLSFYYGPANLRILQAKVEDVGPDVKFIKKGDIISFQRICFARMWDLSDGTKGGWIDSSQVLGYTRSQEAPNVLPNEHPEFSQNGQGL